MSSEIAIKVENLSKCYQIYDQPQDRLRQSIYPRLQRLARCPPKQYFREFWALNNVSFEVRKGETVGIIGRNGCGKSTLLQMICGTLSPTSGGIHTNGSISALLELGSGFNPEFSGRENVYLNAALLGLGRDEIDARFDDVVAFADIGDFLEQPVKTYSSGMAVRLAFAVQAVVDPDIFVVDEALAVGDEKFQRKCFARLEDLKSKGSSILFVSHSPESIIELCDRALLLDHGTRVLCSAPPQTVRAYQKMIYAPIEDYKRLVEEYRALDQGGDKTETVSEGDSPIVSSEQSLATFDPSLVSETTTSYPVQGAEIHSFQIFDSNGCAVNVLQPGGDYQFVVSGRFLANFAGVFFGVHIKSISGVVITGQRYPEQGKFLEQVVAGNGFKITYHFKMDVLPGVYFVGGGIWSSQEPSCAHRILDAIMFRVVPLSRPVSFGYVDLLTREPCVELY